MSNIIKKPSLPILKEERFPNFLEKIIFNASCIGFCDHGSQEDVMKCWNFCFNYNLLKE